MESYEQSILVGEQDIDDQGHVNNIVYLKWVQDVARAHWEKLAPESFLGNVYWVVVSHKITYKAPCFLGEEILLKTRVGDDLSGATWGRHVWIYRGEKLVAEAYTVWCLLDRHSNRPKRITDDIVNIFKTKSE